MTSSNLIIFYRFLNGQHWRNQENWDISERAIINVDAQPPCAGCNTDLKDPR